MDRFDFYSDLFESAFQMGSLFKREHPGVPVDSTDVRNFFSEDVLKCGDRYVEYLEEVAGVIFLPSAWNKICDDAFREVEVQWRLGYDSVD